MESDEMNTNTSSEFASALPPATGSSNINVGDKERILSVFAGTVLSVIAMRNLKKSYGKYLALAGLALVKRGVTGFCEVNNVLHRDTARKKASAIEVKSNFTINRPRLEVYDFWRNLENLPKFMKHIKDVKVVDERRSHWTAKLPGGVGSVSWDAMLEVDNPNSLISWSSLPGSTIDNAGEVKFSNSNQVGQTEVQAKISYRLPAGDAGSIAAKLFNPIVEKMIRDDLRSFKSFMETGEIQTVSQ